MSKAMLTPEAIESQAIFELPERKLPLVTVVITNLLNNLTVDIDVKNNNVAVQICAAVNLLNGILVENSVPVAVLTCDIEQNQ
jgi:hypothetical protein